MDPAFAIAYARRHHGSLARDLGAFVRFASVSSDPASRHDIVRCARWLADRLREAGFARVGLVTAGGSPTVLAEWRMRSTAPTLVVYGHYDVQPPGPRTDWMTPPFEPVEVGDHLHGRGASDDKGPVIAQVRALESWLRGAGGLPVNVFCVFDGEEEIGSPGLRALVLADPGRFRAEAAVVSDTRNPGPGRPAITYALRGTIGMEIELEAGRFDLHAGAFGGLAPGSLESLGRILGGLHDESGRVAVPGFQRDVSPVSPAERAYMARHGPTDDEVRKAAGGAPLPSGPGTTMYERTTLYPALTVTGMTGGHTGPGAGALIPHRARAKLNIRLVPDQEPILVARTIRDHLARSVGPGARVRIAVRSASRPVTQDRRHPVIHAAVRACRRGFGIEPVLLRSGGTIPVVELFVHRLRLPVALLGLALPDDGMHAPNERTHLPTLQQGVETLVWFLDELARMPAVAGRAPAPALEAAFGGAGSR